MCEIPMCTGDAELMVPLKKIHIVCREHFEIIYGKKIRYKKKTKILN